MSGESWGPGPCTGDEPEAVPRLGTPPSCLGQVSPFLLSSLPGFFRAWVCFHAAKPDGKLLLCPGRAKTRQSSLLETPLGSHPSSVWSPHPSGPSLVTPTAVPKTRGHATASALSHLLAPQPGEMGQGGEPQNHGPAPPCVGWHGGTPLGSPWWKMRLSPKRRGRKTLSPTMGQSLVMQSQLEHLPRGASSPDPGAGIASQKGQARVSDARKKSTSAWQALKTHQSPPNLLLPTQQFSVPGRKKI